MDDLLETASRCPHCRASVRPGAPWCTLCHADLRPPPPAPEPEPALPLLPLLPPLPRQTGTGAPLTDAPVLPPRPDDEPTWPCTSCGTANPIAANACGSCGAGFLAGLRETEGPLLELPGVGDLTRMSRGQRLGIAFGVVLAFVALTALLSLVFG